MTYSIKASKARFNNTMIPQGCLRDDSPYAQAVLYWLGFPYGSSGFIGLLSCSRRPDFRYSEKTAPHGAPTWIFDLLLGLFCGGGLALALGGGGLALAVEKLGALCGLSMAGPLSCFVTATAVSWTFIAHR